MTLGVIALIGAIVSVGLWLLINPLGKKAEASLPDLPPTLPTSGPVVGKLDQKGEANIGVNYGTVNFTKENPPSTTPDYIPGTQTTHATLRASFPFGYVIFSRPQDRLINEVFPGDYLGWTADWSKVQIEPNFSDKTVKWSIPQVKGSKESQGSNIKISVGLMVMTIPISVGQFFPVRFFRVQGQPQMYLGTLSDDQRAPIFVIGLRIDDSTPAPNIINQSVGQNSGIVIAAQNSPNLTVNAPAPKSEWPPLTEEQIQMWVEKLRASGIQSIVVGFDPSVNAGRFYGSLKEVGKRLNIRIGQSLGSSANAEIRIESQEDDPAGPIVRDLIKYTLQGFDYPVRYQPHTYTVNQKSFRGIVTVIIGERG